METKTLLWLDDVRDPMTQNWLVFSPIERPFDIVWVKSYEEFTNWITNNGLPDGICFDHDLSDEHYDPSMFVSHENYNELYDSFKEKTGYDCAKWLVDYCIDNNLELPLYNIQSMNPVGKNNIHNYLQNFLKDL